MWTLDELINQITDSLDSVTVAHSENWAKLAFAIKSLDEIKKAWSEREEQYNKDMKKLMDRIKEISHGEEQYIGANEIQGLRTGTAVQLDTEKESN